TRPTYPQAFRSCAKASRARSAPIPTSAIAVLPKPSPRARNGTTSTPRAMGRPILRRMVPPGSRWARRSSVAAAPPRPRTSRRGAPWCPAETERLGRLPGRELQRVLQPIIAPEHLRPREEGGSAEYASAARLLGLLAQAGFRGLGLGFE